MARKRKWGGQFQSLGRENKRLRPCTAKSVNGELVKEALLCQYYPTVLTLREYLLSRLPTSSKLRRKKILAVGRRVQHEQIDESDLGGSCLAGYLDQTLVGIQEVECPTDERWKQWTCFSQRCDNTESTVQSAEGDGYCCQSEIVDFVIWKLFRQCARSGSRIKHLLCQGFRKDVNFNAINREENPVTAIPGIVSAYPNSHVSTLKASPWPQLLVLMGKEGQRMMIDLLLDCGVFVAVENGKGNYFQLSGIPLGDLQIVPEIAFGCSKKEPVRISRSSYNLHHQHAHCLVETRNLSGILFIRSRILYARAALNEQGNVRYGFRHIHVLNRYRDEAPKINREATQYRRQGKSDDTENLKEQDYQKIIRIMMYIFPREFGLHNVFTSFVDPRETVQSLKDYTLREEEIASIYGGESKSENTGTRIKLPKRLRGKASVLVAKLRMAHSQCSYEKLLNHYCPAPGSDPTNCILKTQQTVEEGSTAFDTQISHHTLDMDLDPITSSSSSHKLPSLKQNMMQYATPTANVSAFCRSVLSALIPSSFWGEGDTQTHNKGLFMKVVDRFISLRRFETISLHDAVQGMKIQSICWLDPHCSNNARMSQSDWRKRLDLFHEFVYYVLDSLLIPLIRSHFFVTESNVHQYRIFFFRQDVWRSICEPQLASLKHTILEEMDAADAKMLLDSRTLGFSQLRLLPKEAGVRPIMNLRRRPVKKGNKKILGSSINSILAPVYNMYTYEKNMHPHRLGATMFSVGDIYYRLKKFSNELSKCGKPFFFAKVDVKSAFDTIPQSAILKLMQSLPSESEYRIFRYAEIKPGESHREDVDRQTKSKPIRKWISAATSLSDFQSFKQNVENSLAIGKKHTVFVENIVSQFRGRDELFDLLSQHVRYNMVKIGKKFYRQKKGIPQGSVLSSILCNYFYADLEAHHLSFLNAPESILLRLIDDFLLITTDRQHAKEFLQIMHNGLPEYGVTVNPAKTLVNFEVSINGMKVARLVGTSCFPYCGSMIDTKTLNITRDHERRKDVSIANTLTVEYSKTPGKMFQRKILNAFKLQAHTMYLDTSFNSLSTVISNIYNSFIETATKMWRYAKCLREQKQPGPGVVIRTIQSLIFLASTLAKSKNKNRKNEGYSCAVSRARIEWLACAAFRSVLSRRQARYLAVLAWLEDKMQALRDRNGGKECAYLLDVVAQHSMRLSTE